MKNGYAPIVGDLLKIQNKLDMDCQLLSWIYKAYELTGK